MTFAKLFVPNPKALRKGRGHVKLRFYANGPVRGFECRINRGRYHRCRSPIHFHVVEGIYQVRVRAIGLTGMRGPVALMRIWIGERCIRHSCVEGGGELPPKPHHRRPGG